MKNALSSLAVLGLAIGLLPAVTGCQVEAKSLTRFEGENPLVREAQWLPGSPITIDGRNGRIEVVQGTSDTVRATFKTFVLMAYDTTRQEATEELNKLVAEALGDAGGVSGAVLVRTSREGTVQSSLGADIRVELPPGFDGALAIQQDNGTTDVDFAGSATSVRLNSDNGSCEVTSSPAATEVDLVCDVGDLSANISGAPPGSGTRSIRAGLGDIGLSFEGVPATQPFVVQAFAPDGVVATVNDAAAGCTVNAAAENSKTISCHGGDATHPLYQVNADSLSDITLTF